MQYHCGYCKLKEVCGYIMGKLQQLKQELLCNTLGTFGDKNIESKHCTYDVTLTSNTGACPISTFKPHQIDIILLFYVSVTKGF